MGILFTRAWEDDRLDVALLAVHGGDRVVVVAGAGDTALALTAAGADVTAIDTNSDQLRLVALKAAAARSLEPERLHAWFETGRDPDATATYRACVRPLLAGPTAAWWDERIDVVTHGLHDRWGVGRAFARFGWLARTLVPGMAAAIEEMADPAEQAAYWRARVRPRLFGPLTHFVMARTPILAPLAPNRHELARMRANRWSHGLVRRIDAVVASSLVREHPWWRPALSGRVADLGSGAAWLDPSVAATLAARAATLRLVHGDLADVLGRAAPGSIAAISVSNVPDWLAPDAEAALALAVRRVLAPGGRVLVRRVVAPPLGRDAFAAAGLTPDPLSPDMVARERTALYEQVALFRAP